MNAAVLVADRHIAFQRDLPDPALLAAGDAIVRPTACSICGSDLHPYRGEIPDFMNGCVMGHEFVGEVVEVGPETKRTRRGSRVLASDLIACGTCDRCRRGEHYHCSRATLFGYGTVVGEYVAGGQASLVRVPFADHVLREIPEGVSDEQALFVCDNLTTAYSGFLRSGFQPGEDVLVIGCGAVGLCVLLVARALGAARLFAVDPRPVRAAAAKKVGATVSNNAAEVSRWISDLTGERGIRRIVEAVGEPDALRTAIDAVAPRGVVSVIGAHGYPIDGFDARRCFIREAELRFTVGNPIALAGEVLGLVQSGRVDPAPLISHRLPLSAAAEAYKLFEAAEALKVVLSPES